MTLAIALIAVFALSQFLVFGVLTYFAVQFVRVKDMARESDDHLPLIWEEIADLREWSRNTQEWADALTELQLQIVDRFHPSDEEDN